MDVLDTDVFPVVDDIVYDMVHNLHRHRREEFLKGDRLTPDRKLEGKRKHSNTRRYNVSK